MKWFVAGIATLVIVGVVGVIAVRALVASDPVYSVSQLDAALRSHPATVVDHVIRVRGVVGFCSVRAGCPPNTPPILAAHLGPLSADPPLELQYGTGDRLLATLRGIPMLGALVPRPSPLLDGYQGVLRVRIQPALPYACYVRLCYEGVLQDKTQP